MRASHQSCASAMDLQGPGVLLATLVTVGIQQD